MQKEGRFLFRTTKCPIAGPTCTAVHSTPKEVGHDFASTFGSSLSISSATTGSPAVPEEVARSELPDMPEMRWVAMPPELNAASDRSLSVQVMVVVAAVLATKIFLLWVDLNELVFAFRVCLTAESRYVNRKPFIRSKVQRQRSWESCKTSFQKIYVSTAGFQSKGLEHPTYNTRLF